jgi:hypothetical protein
MARKLLAKSKEGSQNFIKKAQLVQKLFNKVAVTEGQTERQTDR